MGTGVCAVEVFWENGYNIHGDDMCFLFGTLISEEICVEGKSMKDWGLDKKEYVMTLNFMNFVLDDGKFENGENMSIDCTIFDRQGNMILEKDFKRKELEMRETLIPSLENGVKASRRVN